LQKHKQNPSASSADEKQKRRGRMLYVVCPAKVDVVKVGWWSGTLRDLRSRYITYYGRELTIFYVTHNNRNLPVQRHDEDRMKDRLRGRCNVTDEVFEAKYLSTIIHDLVQNYGSPQIGITSGDELRAVGPSSARTTPSTTETARTADAMEPATWTTDTPDASAQNQQKHVLRMEDQKRDPQDTAQQRINDSFRAFRYDKTTSDKRKRIDSVVTTAVASSRNLDPDLSAHVKGGGDHGGTAVVRPFVRSTVAFRQNPSASASSDTEPGSTCVSPYFSATLEHA
jgi:hypothetical protein